MDPISKAQNCEVTTRVVGKPFAKGSNWNGNAGGRPKKREISKIYEKYLKKGVNRRRIISMIDRVIDKGNMAAILQLREMAERTEGKVLQELQINEKLEILTDEQLAERAIKLDAEIEGRLEKIAPELDPAAK